MPRSAWLGRAMVSPAGSAPPANPVIRPGKSQWDRDACYQPFAMFDGQRWRLWYNERHGNAEQIGLATHEGEDL